MSLLVSAADFATITNQTLDSVPALATARVELLLQMATDAVLTGAHGQTIFEVVDDVVTVDQYEGVFYLPQRPVTAVSSVVIGGVELDPSTYIVEPGGDGLPATVKRRWNGSTIPWSAVFTEGIGSPMEPFIPVNTNATITNTHGWASVPGSLVSIAVAMVVAAMFSNMGPQLSLERIVGWEGKWEPGRPADFSLTADDRASIDALTKVQPFGSMPIAGQSPQPYQFYGIGSTPQLVQP